MRRQLSYRELAQGLESGPSLAILPVGCYEQHGPELPLDTDNLIVEECAHRLGDRMQDRFVQVLPTLAYSTTEPNRDYCGTVNVPADPFRQHLREVLGSVMSHPFSAVLILNSHGSIVASLKEIAFESVHRQFQQGLHPVRPVLVANVFDFDPEVGREFALTPGRHADWKEFLLLWPVLGRGYFDEARLQRLRDFAHNHSFPNELPPVLGIPAQLRTTDGVQGQPLPPGGVQDFDEMARRLWDFTLVKLQNHITAALESFSRDFAQRH